MRVLVIAVVLIASVLPAGALTLLPISFDDLVAQSAVVVYGRVAGVHGAWTGDRRRIESLVTLDTLEYYKGALGERVSFKVPGGEAGGMVMAVPGSPVLREGDLLVVFLPGGGPAVPVPIGVSQGVYRVAAAANGAPTVLAPRGTEPGPAVARAAAAAGQGGSGLAALATAVRERTRDTGVPPAKAMAGGGR